MSSKAYLESFVKKTAESSFLVLDTETTGLRNAEIVQIAIINSEGETLLDTLVKPLNPIPSEAAAIHHISDETVKAAPLWAEIAPKVAEILKSQNVVIYNQSFDLDMLHSSDRHAGLANEWLKMAAYFCAMSAYSIHYGDWSSYHHSYKWRPLSSAAQSFGLSSQDAHSALGDCLMTLGVIRGLQAHYASKEGQS